MMKIRFEFISTFASMGIDDPTEFRDSLLPALDALMDELCDLDIEDPDISFNAASRETTVVFIASGEDCLEATINGSAAMRTALHAVGAETAGWGEMIHQQLTSTTASQDDLVEA